MPLDAATETVWSNASHHAKAVSPGSLWFQAPATNHVYLTLSALDTSVRSRQIVYTSNCCGPLNRANDTQPQSTTVQPAKEEREPGMLAINPAKLSRAPQERRRSLEVPYDLYRSPYDFLVVQKSRDET